MTSELRLSGNLLCKYWIGRDEFSPCGVFMDRLWKVERRSGSGTHTFPINNIMIEILENWKLLNFLLKYSFSLVWLRSCFSSISAACLYTFWRWYFCASRGKFSAHCHQNTAKTMKSQNKQLFFISISCWKLFFFLLSSHIRAWSTVGAPRTKANISKSPVSPSSAKTNLQFHTVIYMLLVLRLQLRSESVCMNNKWPSLSHYRQAWLSSHGFVFHISMGITWNRIIIICFS